MQQVIPTRREIAERQGFTVLTIKSVGISLENKFFTQLRQPKFNLTLFSQELLAFAGVRFEFGRVN